MNGSLAAEVDVARALAVFGLLDPDVLAHLPALAAREAVRCPRPPLSEQGDLDRLEELGIADHAVSTVVLALSAGIGAVAELTQDNGWTVSMLQAEVREQ